MKKKVFIKLKTIEDGMSNLLTAMTSLTHSKHTFQDNYDEVWTPNCDVYTTDSKFKIVVELAGIDKNSVEIIFTDTYLLLKGRRDFELPYGDVCYYHMEIDTGNFERVIHFPEANINKESPAISFEKGLLKIEFLLEADVEITIPVK